MLTEAQYSETTPQPQATTGLDGMIAPPWGDRGIAVTKNNPLESILRRSEFDWDISKEPNYGRVRRGERTVYEEVPNSFRLVRSSDQRTLCPYVGKDYKSTQNSEVLEIFDEAAKKAKMTIDTVGTLKDGVLVWALADTKHEFALGDGDLVKGYMLMLYGHEYGRTFRALFTPLRVVSQTLLMLASSRTTSIDDSPAELVAEMHEKAKLLVATQFSETKGIKYLTRLLDKKTASSASLPRTIEEATEKSDERWSISRTTREVLELVATQPGAKLPSMQGTAWAYYNAIIFALDHRLGRNPDTRLESAWIGHAAKLKVRALELAVEMAKK